MKSHTIAEAIKAVLSDGQPRDVKEIYNLIIARELYRFNSKNPRGVIGTEIRRHTEGERQLGNRPSFLQKTSDGKFKMVNVSK